MIQNLYRKCLKNSDQKQQQKISQEVVLSLPKFHGILPIMPLVPGYPCLVPGYPWSVPGYPGSVPACPESVPGCP